MASSSNMAFFVAMAVGALMINSAAAATYTVGDGSGWAIPSPSSLYTNWASNKSFAVGDVLVFRFASQAHDAAQVTKPAYDSCSATNPISLETASPVSITLNSSGEHYFICTFPGHCSAGQKLTVNVTGASSPAPAPAPSTTSPPPSPSPSPSPPAAVPTPAPTTSTPPASAPTPTSSTAPPSGSPTSPSGSPTTPSESPTTPPGSPTTPSGSPPSGSTSPPPPPPSAATSLSAAGLSATFLSIALALIF